MRLIIAGTAMLLCVLCSLAQHQDLAQVLSFSSALDGSTARDILLLIFSLYVVVEGVAARAQLKYQSESLKLDLDAVKQEAGKEEESSPRSLPLQAEELQEQVEQLEEERDLLRTALAEAEKRMAHAQALAEQKKRAESVDAELIHVFSLLQEKGRFIDFLMDDITPYSDQQVGAAARVVHQGCSALLKECFKITAVHQGAEGEKVTLAEGFDALRYRLVGRISGEPPYQGVLLHRGWQTSTVSIPRVAAPAGAVSQWVISPAEVEL